MEKFYLQYEKYSLQASGSCERLMSWCQLYADICSKHDFTQMFYTHCFVGTGGCRLQYTVVFGQWKKKCYIHHLYFLTDIPTSAGIFFFERRSIYRFLAFGNTSGSHWGGEKNTFIIPDMCHRYSRWCWHTGTLEAQRLNKTFPGARRGHHGWKKSGSEIPQLPTMQRVSLPSVFNCTIMYCKHGREEVVDYENAY